MIYRREIDGLRALAVTPVILFHAGFSVVSGGFVGVDVFFVISGYLITSIILGELRSTTFSLLSFYERRARRILPALIVVMALCVPFAWAWMLPAEFKDFSQSLAAVSLFSSNVLFWMESGYFAAAAEHKPLLHTWSLAVEEQYYMFFPLLAIVLLKWGGKAFIVGLVVLSCISLGLSEWGWRQSPSANFYLAPTRAWELFAGSICAFYESEKGRKKSGLLSLTGLVLIVIAIFGFDESTPFPSIYALVPVIGAALIILYGQEGTAVARLLSLKVLVWVGLVSFSAYLWHQPLFAFARIYSFHEPSMMLMTVLAALSFILAWISWKYVEQPFRSKTKYSATTGQVLGVAGLTTAVFVAIGLFGHVTNGQEELWFKLAPPQKVQMYRLIEDARNANLDVQQDDGDCNFNVPRLNPEHEDRIFSCFYKYGKGVVVLGDSHAIDLFGALTSATKHDFIVGISQVLCRPHTPMAPCQYEGFLSFLSRNPETFGLVIYEQAGFYLLLDEKGETGSRDMFQGYRQDTVLPEYLAHPTNISKVADYLASVAAHTRTVWLGPRIEPHLPDDLMLEKGCDFDYTLRPGQAASFQRLDRAIAKEVELKSLGDRLVFASQIDLVKFDPSYDFASCEQLFWNNGDHWSAHGEKRFGKRLASLLDPAHFRDQTPVLTRTSVIE